MKAFIKNHWVEVILSLVYIAATACLVSKRFTYLCVSNDDFLLREIISGKFTGTPDAHMVYVMYPLGLIFSGLYRFAPQIQWYGGFMVFMHYLCWFLICIRIGAQFNYRIKKCVAVTITWIILIIVDLQFLVLNQYTVTAAWFGAVALFWFLTRKSPIRTIKITEYAVCITGLILCLWLRKQVFLMLLPLLVIALIYDFYRKKTQATKQFLIEKGVVIAVLAVLIGGSFVAERFAYGDEWQDYQEYNHARTQICDYYGLPPYEEYAEIYAQNGIMREDYEILQMYNIALLPNTNTEQLGNLAQLGKEYHDWQEQFYSIYRKILYALMDYFLYQNCQPIGTILTMSMMGALIYCFQKRQTGALFALSTGGVYLISFTAYFLWKGRFPERVAYGFELFFLAMILAIVLNVVTEQEKSNTKLSKKQLIYKLSFIAVMLFILGNVAIYQYRNVSRLANEKMESVIVWESTQDFCKEHDNQVFLITSSMYACAGERVFQENNYSTDNMFYLGSWMLHSPNQETQLQRMGLENVMTDLLQKDSVCIMQPANENTDWLKNFYLAHGYDVEVTEAIETLIGEVSCKIVTVTNIHTK